MEPEELIEQIVGKLLDRIMILEAKTKSLNKLIDDLCLYGAVNMRLTTLPYLNLIL